MLRRVALVAGALTALLALPAAAAAVAPNPNPWLAKRFLNIAHQGGEDEAPSNTLFAFKSAIASRGADMLELDVNLTEDGHLVVIHDDTVNRTTEVTSDRPSGTSEVNDLTLAEVQALDAGYTFRPGGHYDKSEPASAYPYRGIADGLLAPPAGYAATDFRIPTLREVLDAFPATPINIEIKMIKTTTGALQGCVTNGDPPMQYCDDPLLSIPTAEALAALLNEPAYAGRSDLIVVSFADQLIDEFHADDAPPKTALAPGLQDTFVFTLDATNMFTPSPDVAAFQVPPGEASFPGLDIPKQLLDPAPAGRNAHGRGYAVHVWPNGAEPESEASYRRLIGLGIDGYMASEPGRLHAVLCADEVPRPTGADRCPNPPQAKKKCKKKQKKKGKGKAAGTSKKKKRKCKKGKKKRR